LNDILQGCIDGKRCAQERLYRTFSSKMFAVSLRYSSNYEEAKDVLQDAFIKIFDKITQFGKRGSLEGWMRRIVVNTALERYRRNNPVVHLDQLPEIQFEIEEDAEPCIPMNELLGYIQALPEKYRMVFNMYVFDDMQHKEIADALGISEGTSKSDLSRARVILQNKITSRVGRIAQTG
jgi:RNA polymerase sigma factor (sigma-70 family)